MLPYVGGGTNTTAALRMLRDVIFQRENGDRVSVRNVAVLIANGESTLHADQVQLIHVVSCFPRIVMYRYMNMIWILVCEPTIHYLP